jgi:enolase
MANRAGYTTVVSHRSGERRYHIADLVVAFNAGQIKQAPSRTDRGLNTSALRIEKSCTMLRYIGMKAFSIIDFYGKLNKKCSAVIISNNYRRD